MTLPASRRLLVLRHVSAALAAAGIGALLAANGCSLILGLTPTSALVDGGTDGSLPAPDVSARDASSDHTRPVHDARPTVDRRAPDAPAPRDTGSDSPPCCSCTGGTELEAGCLVTLAVDASFPISLAIDNASLYWASYGTATEPGSVVTGSVVKVAKTGGAPTTLAADQPFPYRIVVDTANVYWVDLGNQSLTPMVNGQAVQVPLGGGTPVTLAANLATDPNGIAVGNGTVFWTSTLLNGVLESVPIGGGAVASIAYAGGYGTAITFAGGTLYWMGSGGGVWTVVAGSGKTPVGIGGGQPNATAVAAAGGDVYWVTAGPDAGGATVESKPLVDGGAVVTLATFTQPSYPYAMVLDSTSIYWTDLHANRVMKLALGGGGGGRPTTLIETPDGSLPAGIAVDETSVYWTEFSRGTILKLTPK